MTPQNYVSRSSALLKDFYNTAALITPTLKARLGEEPTDALIREAGEEYKTIIPQIPYIGENKLVQTFLFPTTQYLALYRALQRRGWTIDEAGPLIFDVATAKIEAIPRLVRRVMGDLWFSPWLLRRVRKVAKKSQRREYPGAFVSEFVEGDGQTFDYGIDYLECAVCKFLTAHGAMELAPYSCAVDKPASELLGWGLTRTETIAAGFERCNFRFKKGGETVVPLPPTLVGRETR